MFYPTANLNELLNLQEEWFDKEGLISERLWNLQGIEIHTKLLECEPENISYKTILAKLLVEQGWDEKVKHSKYVSARELFLQALEEAPSNYRAHYHLGFLDAYENQWESAIDHFRLALNQPGMEKVRRIKALCESSVCLSWMEDHEGAEKALEKAREFIEEYPHLEHEIRSAEQRMKHEPRLEPNKTIIVTTNNGIRSVSPWEADEIVDQVEEKGATTCLDLRLSKLEYGFVSPEFTGPHDTKSLEPKAAQLLALLMTAGKPLTSNKIREYLWPDSNCDSIVRRYISKLRNTIKLCYPKNEEINSIIQNSTRGYQWSDKRPFIIIEYAGASVNPFSR